MEPIWKFGWCFLVGSLDTNTPFGGCVANKGLQVILQSYLGFEEI